MLGRCGTHRTLKAPILPSVNIMGILHLACSVPDEADEDGVAGDEVPAQLAPETGSSNAGNESAVLKLGLLPSSLLGAGFLMHRRAQQA